MSYFFGHFTPPTDRVWYIIHKVLKFFNILVPTIWKSGSKFLLSEISKKTLEIMKFQADHWGCQIVIFRSFFKFFNFFQNFPTFSHILRPIVSDGVKNIFSKFSSYFGTGSPWKNDDFYVWKMIFVPKRTFPWLNTTMV